MSKDDLREEFRQLMMENEFDTSNDIPNDMTFQEEAELNEAEVSKSIYPDDIMKWNASTFRAFAENTLMFFGKGQEDEAWEYIYAKILQRAGEGDGCVTYTYEELKKKVEEKRKRKKEIEEDADCDDYEEEEDD